MPQLFIIQMFLQKQLSSVIGRTNRDRRSIDRAFIIDGTIAGLYSRITGVITVLVIVALVLIIHCGIILYLRLVFLASGKAKYTQK